MSNASLLLPGAHMPQSCRRNFPWTLNSQAQHPSSPRLPWCHPWFPLVKRFSLGSSPAGFLLGCFPLLAVRRWLGRALFCGGEQQKLLYHSVWPSSGPTDHCIYLGYVQIKTGTGMHVYKRLYKAQLLKQYEVIVEWMTEYLSHNKKITELS